MIILAGISTTDYPVAVRTGTIRTTIIVVLAITCVAAIVALSMWRWLSGVIDSITGGRTDLHDRFEALDAGGMSTFRRRSVVGVAIGVMVTIVLAMILPPLGGYSLGFQQFLDHYEITSIHTTSKFDTDLLENGGSSFRVDDYESGSYPVEWIESGSDMQTKGTIQVLGGRARLVANDGSKPEVRRSTFGW